MGPVLVVELGYLLLFSERGEESPVNVSEQQVRFECEQRKLRLALLHQWVDPGRIEPHLGAY